jgi:hypothetical protein
VLAPTRLARLERTVHRLDVISADPGGQWWAETPRDDWPLEDPQQIAENELIWDEQVGDRRQEIVIIGQDLRITEVTRALDACLLTDAEIAMGKEAWEQFDDPFAPWEIADSEMGEGCELPGDDEEADDQ